jgi:multicomponent Na+:H+ antiporter subunit G
MMIFDIMGYGLISLGTIIIVIGVIGFFRFPDFYTKIHAVGVTEVGGILGIIIGLMILNGFSNYSAKLLLLALILLVTNPTIAHILANAFHNMGKRK